MGGEGRRGSPGRAGRREGKEGTNRGTGLGSLAQIRTEAKKWGEGREEGQWG